MKTTKTVRASRRVSSASTRRPVRASRKAIKAEDEIEEIDDIDVEDIDVDDFEEPEIEEQEILFEAEDVAEVLAEATGEPVDYTVDDETTEVTFTVGENEITVTPEGDEEVVEESTIVRGRKIAASRKMSKPAKKVAASRRFRK